MTSTRSTIPAPPPNGVSSTWPHLRGVAARKSNVSTVCPSASAFSTWRWVRNQSNQCGKSVKTSAFTEKAQVDVDPPRFDVDRADAVTHERHEQLGTVGPVDLEHLDTGQRAHTPHEPDGESAVDHGAPHEVARPVLALLEHRLVARDGQLVAAQRFGVGARGRAFQAQDRSLLGAGPADDPPRYPEHLHDAVAGGQLRRGLDHVEGPVESVRAADATDPQRVTRRCRR